jgi:hypothetical protein
LATAPCLTTAPTLWPLGHRILPYYHCHLCRCVFPFCLSAPREQRILCSSCFYLPHGSLRNTLCVPRTVLKAKQTEAAGSDWGQVDGGPAPSGRRQSVPPFTTVPPFMTVAPVTTVAPLSTFIPLSTGTPLPPSESGLLLAYSTESGLLLV